MVSCRAMKHVTDQIKDGIKEENLSNSVSCQDFSEILGCQYPNLIMVLDLAPLNAYSEEILMLMTRAITSLTIIINRSPTTANNHPEYLPYKSSDGNSYTLHQLVLAYFGKEKPIPITKSEIELD